MVNIFEKALKASKQLNLVNDDVINRILLDVANAAENKIDYLLSQNKLDLDAMSQDNPIYDRLMLTEERIKGIAEDLRNVVKLHSPVGEVLNQVIRPNGMIITKKRVPFGVVGVIYEARPNVSFDVFSLCVKTHNACILKGGKDARYSNCAIVELIRGVIEQHGLNPDIVTLLPVEREATAALLNAVGYVDLIIPRGSSSLINYVRENSRIPVIETGAGICHTYFDVSGDVEKGSQIVFNAKTRRVSVCNALDSLVIHSSRLNALAQICTPLAAKNVIIYADDRAYLALQGKYPEQLLQKALAESFGTEFLDYKMSVKTVDSLDDAIEHISRYSSRHSEAIITEDEQSADEFSKRVDAACVYTNVSTAFTDGAQFGFGAEIGISTQKLHARGPMALPELTTYKYIITGNGQTRN